MHVLLMSAFLVFRETRQSSFWRSGRGSALSSPISGQRFEHTGEGGVLRVLGWCPAGSRPA